MATKSIDQGWALPPTKSKCLERVSSRYVRRRMAAALLARVGMIQSANAKTVPRPPSLPRRRGTFYRAPIASGRHRLVPIRLSLWTFDKFICGNVGAVPPRFQSGSADRADRVTRMRHQELVFGASVLGAAIALHNCRHLPEYALRTVGFPARHSLNRKSGNRSSGSSSSRTASLPTLSPHPEGLTPVSV